MKKRKTVTTNGGIQPSDTAQTNDAPVPQKKVNTALWVLQNFIHSAWICLLWSFLGWLWYIGLQFALLAPLNYFTGAMLGLTDGTLWGGVLGRTLILVFLNGFFTTFVNHKGKGKWKAAFSYCKNALLNLIPYFQNFKQLRFQDRLTHTTNFIGLGVGLVLYTLVTGDGTRMETFSALLLFVALAGEAVQRRGFFIALLNIILSRFGFARISRKPIDGIVNGAALGTLLGTLYSLVRDTHSFVLWAGIACILCGSLLLLRTRNQLIKECAQCED